jgi:hypothetical protein
MYLGILAATVDDLFGWTVLHHEALFSASGVAACVRCRPVALLVR